VAQIYSQALGSLFIISYNLQEYDGGILPRLHMMLWRFSSPPPHSEVVSHTSYYCRVKVKVKVNVILQLTVSQPVCPGIKQPTFLSFPWKLYLDSWGFVITGWLLSQEDGSVIYSCCWASPARSYIYFPQDQGYIPGHCVHFCHFLQVTGLGGGIITHLHMRLLLQSSVELS
jgi:hypothetical protein